MLTPVFRTTWIHFLKQPYLTVLNLLGLGAGLVGAIYLWQFVLQESTFDQQHTDYEKVFLIPMQLREPNGINRWAVSPVPLGPELVNNYPDVAMAARVFLPDRIVSLSFWPFLGAWIVIAGMVQGVTGMQTMHTIRSVPATALRNT